VIKGEIWEVDNHRDTKITTDHHTWVVVSSEEIPTSEVEELIKDINVEKEQWEEVV